MLEFNKLFCSVEDTKAAQRAKNAKEAEEKAAEGFISNRIAHEF